jgi:Arylsulfotransferase (ASST)
VTGCGGDDDIADSIGFRSRPDIRPPVVSVLKRDGNVSPGYLFIAPKQHAPFKGPEILDNAGEVVWFAPVTGQATDFRVQTYRGKPVLTWWEGPPEGPVLGSGVGHGVVVDSSYRQIARIEMSFRRDTADLHEIQLTPRGTALIMAYRIVPRDLGSVGGPKNGKAVDNVVQEVEVASGRALFTWHSLGHVALNESYAPAPPKTGDEASAPFDYFHINSIEEDDDGSLLISARNTHAVYAIDRRTGDVRWRLGGKQSSYRMGAGTTFAWQHDARRHADGSITIFDNGAAPPVEKQSRAIRLRLDPQAKTATLVKAYVSPAKILSSSQGNMHVLPDGHVLVGWGNIPRFTEFDAAGRVVYDASFSEGDDSYRAYRFPWTGTPLTRPSIAVDRGGDDSATVYVSWNGATAVRRWRVLAGLNAEHLTKVGEGARDGFETKLEVPTDAPFIAVQALGADGKVLATSAAVERGGNAIG